MTTTITRDFIHAIAADVKAYAAEHGMPGDEVKLLAVSLSMIQGEFEADDAISAITLRVTGSQRMLLDYLGW